VRCSGALQYWSSSSCRSLELNMDWLWRSTRQCRFWMHCWKCWLLNSGAIRIKSVSPSPKAWVAFSFALLRRRARKWLTNPHARSTRYIIVTWPYFPFLFFSFSLFLSLIVCFEEFEARYCSNRVTSTSSRFFSAWLSCFEFPRERSLRCHPFLCPWLYPSLRASK
jgi:hypothetical protein